MAAEAPPAGRERPRNIGPLLERFALPAFLLLLVVVFSVWLPVFRTASNFESMLNSQAITVMLAVIATVALRADLPDFSIASIMVLASVVVAQLTPELPTVAVLAVGIAVSLVIGLIHAFLVVRVGVNVFVLSLGSLTALGGIALAIANSAIVTTVPDALVDFTRHELFGLPTATWLSWLFVLVAWYVFDATPLGRYLLFVGGNPDSSRLAGVRVARLRFGVLVVNAVLSGFVGIILVGQLGAIDASVGHEYLLGPFAAAFLGATAIQPGRFNAIGTLLATYLLVVGITGLQLLGAASWATDAFNGTALIVAVTLARLGRKVQG